MKTLATLLLICTLSQVSLSQKRQLTNISTSKEAKNSLLFYSQEEDALVLKDTNFTHSEVIVIESLPYFDKLTIPVYIDQQTKGTYSFKKHASLELPEYYSVIIVDRLTGQSFDLKTQDSYTFQVTKDIPERFELKIDKIKTTLTAMR